MLFVLSYVAKVKAEVQRRTEWAGFDLPSLCEVLNSKILQLNSNYSKDLKSLVDLLFLHDFSYLRLEFEGNLRVILSVLEQATYN